MLAYTECTTFLLMCRSADTIIGIHSQYMQLLVLLLLYVRQILAVAVSVTRYSVIDQCYSLPVNHLESMKVIIHV